MNKIWKWTFVFFVVCCLSLTAMAQKGGIKKKSTPQPKKVTTSQPTKIGVTLAQIIEPFLLPAGGPETETGWGVLDATGIIWRDKAPVKGTDIDGNPNGKNHRSGNTTLVRLESSVVNAFGTEKAVSYIEFNCPLRSFRLAEFSKVLREQFGPEASIKLLRAQCPDELPTIFASVYEVVLKGKKPIYVFVESIISPSSGYYSSSIEISRQKREAWDCL